MYLLFCYFRHVKGRVLVALADGTLAIFHRGEGKNHCNRENKIWLKVWQWIKCSSEVRKLLAVGVQTPS